MPRFVLLYHACPPGFRVESHWDLMLEAGQSLRTWALPHLPSAWRAAYLFTTAVHPDCPPVAVDDAIDVRQLVDHRLAYLDYEGPISGDRGRVMRIDSGHYTGATESRQCWQSELEGRILRGTIVLEPFAVEPNQWILRCLLNAPGG